ncbi:MAG: hypothetical protein AAF065_14680 [Verrucomicrobiota bacterium]
MAREDTAGIFKALAGKTGMCPATALLDPVKVAEQPIGADYGGASLLSTEGKSPAWELPQRQMIECVCTGPSVGGQSFLECLINASWPSGVFTALVDAGHGFDPGSLKTGPDNHFFWVQVRSCKQLTKALDIILRDDNFAFVAADLRGLSNAQLQTIQPFVWYRLQRLAHQRAGGCVVFTRKPSVRCADRRIALSRARCLDDLDQSRETLLTDIQNSVHYMNRGQVTIPEAAIAG